MFPIYRIQKISGSDEADKENKREEYGYSLSMYSLLKDGGLYALTCPGTCVSSNQTRLSASCQLP